MCVNRIKELERSTAMRRAFIYILCGLAGSLSFSCDRGPGAGAGSIQTTILCAYIFSKTLRARTPIKRTQPRTRGIWLTILRVRAPRTSLKTASRKDSYTPIAVFSRWKASEGYLRILFRTLEEKGQDTGNTYPPGREAMEFRRLRSTAHDAARTRRISGTKRMTPW